MMTEPSPTPPDPPAVVVREAGERTADACAGQLERAFGVTVARVREQPFERALRASLELGVASGRDWLLVVDADVLPQIDAVRGFVAAGRAQPAGVFHCHPWVLDRFSSYRSAGVRLWRCERLPAVIDRIPADGAAMRPETAAVRATEATGLRDAFVPTVVGLHDYEQSLADVRRTCFLHALKHPNFLSEHVPRWKRAAAAEPDFLAALQGFAAGVLALEGAGLHAGRTADLAAAVADVPRPLPEKGPLPAGAAVDGLVTAALAAADPPDFGLGHLTAAARARARLSREARRLGWRAAPAVLGRALAGAGRRLQRVAEPAAGPDLLTWPGAGTATGAATGAGAGGGS